ncbi:MAG: Gfo/Idh/MocA family oxidoreductase [Planctomycetota bacterium]
MVRVGVIGAGMMGATHLDAYAQLQGVEVVAIAARNPQGVAEKLSAGGNIEGMGQGKFDLSGVRLYAEGHELIADPNVDLVDVCLPTTMHLDYGLAVLEAGKHLLMEKPLARTYAEALQLADAADTAPGLSMAAMCMRFWPGWDWLKKAIDDGRYGRVRSATFRRVAPHPGGPAYLDGTSNGGALLDLHVHDADFVRHCFGMPQAVRSVGYASLTGAIDHVSTQYVYAPGSAPGIAPGSEPAHDKAPELVTAEGGWAMADGFDFTMRYTVNFDAGTADWDLTRDPVLKWFPREGEPETISLSPEMGYKFELEALVRAISDGGPSPAPLRDAAESLRLVEAEARSIELGQSVEL